MATQLAETDGGEIAISEEVVNDTRDYETEARERGWTPKDEFKGDPSRWIEAEDFVKNAETKMPLLSKENKHLKDKIEFLERTVKRLTKAEQNAYKSAVDDLKRQQREAVEYGDVKAFENLDKQIDRLRDDMTEDAPEDAKAAFVEFREANEWYDLGGLPGASAVERRARALADRIADKFTAQGLQQEPGMTPAKFFAQVADAVREQLPMVEGQKAPRQKPASDVAGVTRQNGARNVRSGANLPNDAKAQADRFFANGVYPKAKNVAEAREMYAKSYQWD